jgi:hypothetical protein
MLPLPFCSPTKDKKKKIKKNNFIFLLCYNNIEKNVILASVKELEYLMQKRKSKKRVSSSKSKWVSTYKMRRLYFILEYCVLFPCMPGNFLS